MSLVTAVNIAKRGLATIVSVLGLSCRVSRAEAQTAILVDQCGYRPHDPKIAFIKESQNGTFSIVNTATNKLAYQGVIRAIGTNDAATHDAIFSLDFTKLTAPGKYQILLPGTSWSSPEFSIDENVYNGPALAAIESFYFQRCGSEVGKGTLWEHPPCHTNDARLFWDPSIARNETGGWHDAGDYNKFVPTTAVSAGFLLYLYERQPEAFSDGQLAIPEAGNGVPDILDEARWALQWLLKMQDTTGGVFHKVSIRKWTGEHLPQNERDPQFIFSVSSAATADFAAVTALAARLFEPWDRLFAQTLLRASLRSWSYLETHPFIVPAGGFKNPPGVEGGEYRDEHDEDERLWASVELLRTTGSNRFRAYFLSKYKSFGGFGIPVSWQHVEDFAFSSYLRMPANRQDLDVRAFLASSVLQNADQLLLRIEQNGYRYVLKDDEYYWGSNSVALGYAFDLIQAYDFSRSRRYLDAALDQLHYVLGRNTFDRSFETGVGVNPVRHPYHQFSMLTDAGKPVPGMLVAGVNKYSRLRGQILSNYPGRCYEDNEKNYFVNETAINYTAPLVYVAGCLSNLGRKNISADNMQNR